MNYFIIWNFLLVILQSIGLLKSDYIYTELNGDIVNSKINFTVYFTNGSGVIFYSYDLNNRFLIKLDEENETKILTIKFNQYLNSENLEIIKLCGCLDCSNILLTINLLLEKHEILATCNEKSNLLKLKSETKIDNFAHYPIPLNKVKNKISIWMGNIGPYIGFGNNLYHSMNSQIIGCLDSLYLNDRLIKIQNYEKKFSSHCDVNYNETVCSIRNCFDQKISYKRYDCSIFSLNGKYCQFKLEEYSNENNTLKRIRSNERNFFLKLNWKKEASKTLYKYCLIKFVLSDNSSLLFHVNEKNILILSTKVSHVNIYQNIFTCDLFGISNSLIIYFSENHFTVKIFDGYNIKTYSHSISSDVILLDLGYFPNTDSISRFSGEIYLNYDKTIWAHSVYPITATTEREINTEINNTNIYLYIILCGIFLICLIIAVTVFVLFNVFKRRTKSNFDDENNRTTHTKTPSPNPYEYELALTNLDENANVNTNINENGNADTADDVYERISENTENSK